MTMKLPSGSQWDAGVPAFESREAFLQSSRFVSHRGEEVSGAVLHWGKLLLDADQEIEVFDLLFDDDPLCHALSAGVYRVDSLVEDPSSKGFGGDTYFSMISRSDLAPERWEPIGQYGADGSNMAIAAKAVGQRFRAFREEFETGDSEEDMDRWNLLTELALGYDADAAEMISEIDIQLSPPDGEGSLVVMRSSKIASLFAGYSGEVPVAIQGRWL